MGAMTPEEIDETIAGIDIPAARERIREAVRVTPLEPFDSRDKRVELRLKLDSRMGRWTFDADWQLVGLSADTLPLTALPNDDRRLFDLTGVISESSNEALLHRLDRLWLGYTSETTVVRF